MDQRSQLTGYPSIDRPWMKYYSEKSIIAKLSKCSIYQAVYNANKNTLYRDALDYYGRKVPRVDNKSKALSTLTSKISSL